MKGRWHLVAAIVLGMLAAGSNARADKIAPRVEEPAYVLERTVEGLEIRRYAASVVAETDVEGTYSDSISDGFRRLAGYIFGGNAPAQQIAMTAPVGAAPHGGGQRWTITFTLPSALSLDKAPQPVDKRVHLRALPERSVAALRFGGRADDNTLRVRARELANVLARAGLRPAGEPQLAQYDPPWTPEARRRNELLVLLK